MRLVEDPQVIDDLREQLEAAEQTLATARSRDVEQAQGLQEALRSQAAELREAHQAEVTAWKQQLDAEKERARKRWKTNCEHLAEQDAIIAGGRDSDVTGTSQGASNTSPRMSHCPLRQTRGFSHQRSDAPLLRHAAALPVRKQVVDQVKRPQKWARFLQLS